MFLDTQPVNICIIIFNFVDTIPYTVGFTFQVVVSMVQTKDVIKLKTIYSNKRTHNIQVINQTGDSVISGGDIFMPAANFLQENF